VGTSSTTTTMHYGGSYNAKSPTGLSPNPSKGSSFKKTKRLEYIVRLENAGMPERVIANMLTISVPRLRYLKKSADFLTVRMRITHGIVLDHEASLSQIKEQRREVLKELLPDCLKVIANVVQTPALDFASKKLQVSTALDVLDREGTFAKITRTEVKPVENFDFEKADKESDAIVAVVKGIGACAPKSEVEQIQDAVSINEQFAKSSMISAVDQQTALDELEFSESKLLEMPSESEEVQ
jgi:hypothetical protein